MPLPAVQISSLIAPFTWKTGANFETIVTDAAGRTAVPVLPAKAQASKSQIANGRYLESFVERVVKPWGPLAKSAEAKYGFPAPWTLSVIEAESAGRQRAHASSGAVGLMQLVSVKEGHSDQELMDDPALNVDLGVKFLAGFFKKKQSFPDILSMYNCGPGCWAKPHSEPCDSRPVGSPSHSIRGPWGGLCEQGVSVENDGYISRAVAAANSATGIPLSDAPLPAPSSRSTLSVVPALLGVGAVIWLAKKYL